MPRSSQSAGPLLTADDIRWASEPLPRVEDVDLLTLDADELLDHARDLQRELAAVRASLHVAGTALSGMREAAVKLKASNLRQIEETRRLRAFVMKLDQAA